MDKKFHFFPLAKRPVASCSIATNPRFTRIRISLAGRPIWRNRSVCGRPKCRFLTTKEGGVHIAKRPRPCKTMTIRSVWAHENENQSSRFEKNRLQITNLDVCREGMRKNVVEGFVFSGGNLSRSGNSVGVG